MSDEITLGSLDFNGLWTAREAQNRDVRADVGVFRGNLSFSVFDKSKGGAPVFKFPIPRDFSIWTKLTFSHLLTAAPGTKYSVAMETYNPETRTSTSDATVIYGVDTKGTPYVGITCPAGSFKFPLRMGLKFNVGSSGIPDEITRAAAIAAFTDVITQDAQGGRLLSNQRRKPKGNGGGGGYNNGGNRGGSSYGGNNNSGGSSNSSGDADFAF